MWVVDVVVMVFAKAGVSRAECPLKVEYVHLRPIKQNKYPKEDTGVEAILDPCHPPNIARNFSEIENLC